MTNDSSEVRQNDFTFRKMRLPHIQLCGVVVVVAKDRLLNIVEEEAWRSFEGQTGRRW